MRRIYLTFALFCLLAALFAAAYGYYILVRNPGLEIGVIEFIRKVLIKIAKFLIHG